jgi:hypothetical protein
MIGNNQKQLLVQENGQYFKISSSVRQILV